MKATILNRKVEANCPKKSNIIDKIDFHCLPEQWPESSGTIVCLFHKARPFCCTSVPLAILNWFN